MRAARRIDDVDAGHFGLLAAVFGVTRHDQFLTVCAQHGAVALVKPFGRRTAAVRLGAPPFDAEAKHPHAVGQIGLALSVHLCAVFGAAQVSQARSADEASRRLGVIDWNEQTPWGRAGVYRIVVEQLGRRALLHQRRKRDARSDRRLGKCQHGVSAIEQAQRRLFDASHAPRRATTKLNEPRCRGSGAPLFAPSHLHLMLQPILGRCSSGIARPATSASSAARRSLPVTGTSLPGRLSSSWPR